MMYFMTCVFLALGVPGVVPGGVAGGAIEGGGEGVSDGADVLHNYRWYVFQRIIMRLSFVLFFGHGSEIVWDLIIRTSLFIAK